jgi:hypothetical protein
MIPCLNFNTARRFYAEKIDYGVDRADRRRHLGVRRAKYRRR